MTKSPLLAIVLIGFLSGCSNLMTASPPDTVLAGVHAFGTTALAYSADGKRLISGGYRGELRLWDAATQRQLGEIHAHMRAVRAILPLPSGGLVSGGDDGRLILWRDNQAKSQVETAEVTAIALFRGQIVSGHADRRLRIWSVDTLQPIREILLDDAVEALSVSGNQLAVGLDHAIQLLDADFRIRRIIPDLPTPHDLQFSPDGRILAAGSWFKLQLWDVASGKRHAFPTEHNGLLTSIAFSPDGRFIATLGRHTDSAIRILDTTDFSTVHRYQAHDLCGAIIRFSPDGTMLASGSDDESVRLYRTAPFRSANAQSSNGAMPSAH